MFAAEPRMYTNQKFLRTAIVDPHRSHTGSEIKENKIQNKLFYH